MPSIFKSAAALAMAGAAFANPLKRGSDDACVAAVTGKAALGDESIRKSHCASFIKTIVTPSAVTVTTTITDAPKPTDWENYKRDVTVCPNEVPNYASACDEAGYKSACKVFGISGETTITIPATTTTKTVYIGNNWNGNGNGKDGICTSTSTAVITSTKSACSGGITTATITETSTTTAAQATITVTVTEGGKNGTHTTTGSGSGPTDIVLPGCLSDVKAKEFVDAFIDLLEYTNYDGSQGGPPGRGYHANVSAKYLATDFKDYSDSINWMAGFPLGGVTFDGRAAFDYGQGQLQAELGMKTEFIAHSCKEITWKWTATPFTGASIKGINHMILNADLTQIQTNHAEFDNAAWIDSFGISCKVPSGSSNGTTPASRRMFH